MSQYTSPHRLADAASVGVFGLFECHFTASEKNQRTGEPGLAQAGGQAAVGIVGQFRIQQDEVEPALAGGGDRVRDCVRVYSQARGQSRVRALSLAHRRP